jgi:hypothetical protein
MAGSFIDRTDPTFDDLGRREVINVRCKCGREVQIAPFQLIGHHGIAKHTKVWSLRDRFSARTKAALAAAKARGTRLGGRRRGAADIAAYQHQGVTAALRRADAKADELRETVEGLKIEGLSLNVMAARLNDQGVLTSRARSGGWTATAVKRVLARLAA